MQSTWGCFWLLSTTDYVSRGSWISVTIRNVVKCFHLILLKCTRSPSFNKEPFKLCPTWNIEVVVLIFCRDSAPVEFFTSKINVYFCLLKHYFTSGSVHEPYILHYRMCLCQRKHICSFPLDLSPVVIPCCSINPVSPQGTSIMQWFFSICESRSWMCIH